MRTGFFVRVDSFNIKGFIENKQDNFMIHCALDIPSISPKLLKQFLVLLKIKILFMNFTNKFIL